jgi:hypothetical protein
MIQKWKNISTEPSLHPPPPVQDKLTLAVNNLGYNITAVVLSFCALDSLRKAYLCRRHVQNTKMGIKIVMEKLLLKLQLNC